MNAVAANRRQILQGTAVLALGMTASGRVVLAAEEAAAPPAPIGPRMFDVWLQFKPDNTLTFISPELESGQGVITGLAILVADELDADWSKVAVVQSGTDRIYANPMSHSVSTNASASIRMRFDQMRKIGATAREMLKAAAAAQWSVPVAELTTDKSTVAHAASKRSATYTSLAAAAAKLPVPENVALRPKSQWKLIGKSIPRIDIEDKCTGRAQYGVDFRMPGMLHAAVARGPVFGAKVKSFDDAAAKARKGVKAVENMGYGVAVVADDAWTARRAQIGRAHV